MTPGESLNRMTGCFLSDPLERGNAGGMKGSSPPIYAELAQLDREKLRGAPSPPSKTSGF